MLTANNQQLTPAQIQAIEVHINKLITANKLLKPATITAIQKSSIYKKQAIIPKLEQMLKFQQEKTRDYLKKHPNALVKIKHDKIAKNMIDLHHKEDEENKREDKILHELEREISHISTNKKVE